jgi:hypothetical protein
VIVPAFYHNTARAETLAPAPLALRPAAAAASLGISESSLERLRLSGKVPSVKLNGVRVYPVDGLKAALEASREGGEPK